MRIVTELAWHLNRRGLLTEQQLEQLVKMGVLEDLHCEVCGALNCRVPSHNTDRWYPWERDDGLTDDGEPDPTPPEPTKKSFSGTPAHATRADEIAKRLSRSDLLSDPCLRPLGWLNREGGGEQDWFKSLPQLSQADLQAAILKKRDDISPTQLWEALAFDRYRLEANPEGMTGPAATAWRLVLEGRDTSEMGKRQWILGRRRVINRVWQLIRAQNAVLVALGRLMRHRAPELARWAEQDYHPIGSLALCLSYESQARSLGVETEPGLRPDWSAWDGQRYRATRWSEKTAASRSWEMAFRMDGSAYALLAESEPWEAPLSLESPLTHPRFWRQLDT